MDAGPQIQNEPTPPYPKQKLKSPGLERDMELKPRWRAPRYKAAGKLEGKVALITGGDSGIGRSVAYLFAREGAKVVINYLPEEQEDAEEIKEAILELGEKCELMPGDLTSEKFCRDLVERTVNKFGGIDILVSNAAYQQRKQDLADITTAEWRKTFRTNMDAYFLLAQESLKHMKAGASIIVTASETAVLGSQALLDYSSTKGAIIAFTKSLAQNLVTKGIRVNAVAPGPVWTPLNPADEGQRPEYVAKFGKSQAIKRAAQPEEIAPAYVFLASDADSSYISGIVLEEMGGTTGAA